MSLSEMVVPCPTTVLVLRGGGGGGAHWPILGKGMGREEPFWERTATRKRQMGGGDKHDHGLGVWPRLHATMEQSSV